MSANIRYMYTRDDLVPTLPRGNEKPTDYWNVGGIFLITTRTTPQPALDAVPSVVDYNFNGTGYRIKSDK